MAGADLTPVTWHSLWTIEGLVALGTLALALVTTFLAWRTSTMASKTATLATSTEQLARLTEQDVALSRTAIEADVRPVLVAVPHAEFVREQNYLVTVPGTDFVRGSPDRATIFVQVVEEVERLFVSVPLRNEGTGIAFITNTMLRMPQGGELIGVATTTQVPPRGFTRGSFAVLPNEQVFTVERLAADGGFSVVVTYSDLAGNVWGSRLRVQRGVPDWVVVGVEISSEGRRDEVVA